MSRRNQTRDRKKRDKRRSRLIWGGAAVVILGLLFVLIRASFQPSQGESVPILGADHVGQGSVVRVEGNDPPTSGDHYDQPAPRGFHETPFEDGYLIHNLEHGYIVIWYDCTQMDDEACQTLKSNIQGTIAGFADFKIVGVPREGMSTAIALTSWGQIDKLEWYDEQRIGAFIRANHNRAPEPNAS